MLPHKFKLLIFLIVCAAPASTSSNPPFKLVAYTFTGAGVVYNDTSLTLFRRIKGPSCHIYQQEGTKDAFPDKKGEWFISIEVTTADDKHVFECTIKFPLNEITPWAYKLFWDVFPGKEISIVNDPATKCLKETIEYFKAEFKDYECLFMSVTEVQDQMICRFQHFKDLKTEPNRDSSLISLGDDSSNCSVK